MFERTLESTSQHTEEEVAEEQDLNEEEDTSTDAGQSEENDTEQEEDTSTNDADEADDAEEETVTLSKTEHEKLLRERDSYKQGMLSHTAKKRSMDKTVEAGQGNVNEKAVMAVLEKQHERKALRDTIDDKSPSYIPELVDDTQYQEIIGYLPRNIDKSSPETIVKALKIATKLWKEDRGIVDKPKDKGKKAAGEVAETRSSGSSGAAPRSVNKGGRKILKSSTSTADWY